LMLRDRFPEIFSVYTPTIAQLSVLPPPGQQVVVVVPAVGARDNDDPLRPAFSQPHLASMQDWLQSHASPWAEIVVRNPQYRNVEIRYDVVFDQGGNPDYGSRRLKEDLSMRYMAWSGDAGSGVVAGNVLDYYGMVAWIQQRPYVSRVVDLTLDGGKVSVQGADTEVLILHWPDSAAARTGGAGDD